MKTVIWTFIKPTIRHGLQVAGGALAAKGFIDESQIEAFIGIGVNVLTAVWMWVDMKKKKA